MADLKVKRYDGSAQLCINSAANIAAGNFSGAPSLTFANNDAVVPNAKSARATLLMPGWGGTPVAGTVIELWGVAIGTDGASNDTDAPSGTSAGGAIPFGSWPVAGANAAQRRTIIISIDGLNNIDFYTRNGTAVQQTNNGGTNYSLKITPFTDGVPV